MSESRSFIIPSAPEAEAAVLCALAQWPDETMAAIREDQLSADWFWHSGHRRIFELITAELAAKRRIDFITLSTRARDLAMQDAVALVAPDGEVTGAVALSRLFTFTPETHHLGGHLDELREKYVARELRRVCTETIAAVDQNWKTAGITLAGALSAKVSELTSFGIRNENVRHAKHWLMPAIEKVQQAFDSRGRTFGVPTGIPRLDRMTNGLRAGFTYYLCGRPGSGKSALMCHLMSFATTLNPDSVALVHGLIFSLEMTGLQLVMRELLKVADVPLQRARDGLMSEERDFPRLTEACKTIAAGNLFVDETSVVTMDDIASRTRRFVRKVRGTETAEQFEARKKNDRPDIIIAVDYIQRAKASSERAKQARYLELAELAQGLSALAKDLHISVIVLCQLGRPEPEGWNHLPKLSDLRESGDMEAEAHVVIAVHRPISYIDGDRDKQEKAAQSFKHLAGEDRTEEKGGIPVGDKNALNARDLHHLTQLVVLKQREGPVGVIPVHFEPGLTRFEGWDENERLYSNNAEHRQGGHSAPEPAEPAPATEPADDNGEGHVL